MDNPLLSVWPAALNYPAFWFFAGPDGCGEVATVWPCDVEVTQFSRL